MINILLFMEMFTILFKDIEINHDYLDTQINISVSNFIDEYESYQEKNKFNFVKFVFLILFPYSFLLQVLLY